MEREADIIVLWLRGFYDTDTKVRELFVRTNAKWREFSGSCFLPWYKNNRSWSAPDSENYTLQEFAKNNPSKLRKREDLLIMTAYHTLIDRRLIVDGIHRAIAVETLFNRKKKIPVVRVLECFGSELHSIFFADFNNLVAKTLRNPIRTK